MCRDRVIENPRGLVETSRRSILLGDRDLEEGPCRSVRETLACVEPGVLPDRKYANGWSDSLPVARDAHTGPGSAP